MHQHYPIFGSVFVADLHVQAWTCDRCGTVKFTFIDFGNYIVFALLTNHLSDRLIVLEFALDFITILFLEFAFAMTFVLFPLTVILAAVAVMIFSLTVSLVQLEIACIILIAGVFYGTVAFHATLIELTYVHELPTR